MRIIFEWDEKKRKSNLAKHGVDFSAVYEFDWEFALHIPQRRSNEARYLTLAPIAKRLFALIWTERKDAIRIISLRKANKREVLIYAKKTIHTD